MHIIPSAIALTPLSILSDLQPPPSPTQFSLPSLQLVFSMSSLTFIAFTAHSLALTLLWPDHSHSQCLNTALKIIYLNLVVSYFNIIVISGIADAS